MTSTSPTGGAHRASHLGLRRTTRNRALMALAAAAVVGGVLPLGATGAFDTASGAGSAGHVAAKPKGKPAFAGYTSDAWSSPVEVDIYEPTIPIPASPQAELEVGYSTVHGDSSGSHARASYIWPGDPVGEGFKTIIENLGLPPQLADPIAANGYPDQVNANNPSGPAKDSDEPFPGSIQRVTADKDGASAENGISGDGEATDDSTGGSGGGGGLPGLPGIPIPGVGGLGGLGGVLGDLLGRPAATTGASSTFAKPAAAKPADGPLPPELSALVDVGTMTSVSKTHAGRTVQAHTRAAAGDISILGGLVTIPSVRSSAAVESDGKKGVPEGEADYTKITAFGQTFRVGPDGVEAVGQGAPIPGLPDQAGEALKQLGLVITVPKPKLEKDGDTATSTVQGLVIDFDLTTLKSQLSALPLSTVIDLIPQKDIKSLVQAAANLSPRIVFTLATSTAKVDTVPPIVLPTIPPVTPTTPVATTTTPTPTTTTPTTTPTTAAPTSAAPAPSSGPTPGGTVGGDTTPPGGDTPSVGGDTTPPPDTTADGVLPPTTQVSAGIPGLFTLSGLLILGGLVLAGLMGWGTGALGGAALGGGSSCDHGLDSGLPDLRKVQ